MLPRALYILPKFGILSLDQDPSFGGSSNTIFSLRGFGTRPENTAELLKLNKNKTMPSWPDRKRLARRLAKRKRTKLNKRTKK